MEPVRDQSTTVGSPSKLSFFGSFYLPPEKVSAPWLTRFKQPLAPTTSCDGAQRLNVETHGGKPEASSAAVIAALKTLQAKIKRLELERAQAESSMRQLSEKAQWYRGEPEQPKTSNLNVQKGATQDTELVAQLRSAESRCCLLEKQLDYMRKMVENAERDKNAILEKQVSLQKEKLKDQEQVHGKLEKLEMLEQECLRLTSTQSMAEKKIQQLEHKLLEEEHQRKLIQEKAAQLQTGLEMNRILHSAVSSESKPRKAVKKKKAKISTTKNDVPKPVLFPKAKQLPFVAGTKNLRNSRCENGRGLRGSVSSSSAPSSGGSLSDLLLALQDELGQMSFEHQELVTQIQETERPEVREDLERELDSLVKRMEVKGDQISKLKRHQKAVETLKQKSKMAKRQAPRAQPRTGGASRVESARRSSPCKSAQGLRSQDSLQLLKKVQKLQLHLKKDDITWEQ
ncbi:centrosomal protein CEP57L1 isoform X1 [Lepisosteus oculatus]|uniref:centrosomal protein CEP57L1 isoform X1 n=1 Tax=Lepisosteus oculatus TaxID=7918 RepID=UPI0035F52BE0